MGVQKVDSGMVAMEKHVDERHDKKLWKRIWLDVIAWVRGKYAYDELTRL